MKIYFTLICSIASLLVGCSQRQLIDDHNMTMIHITDRNDMVETISSRERLDNYEKLDYMSPQPYKQVVRVFRKDKSGRQPSILTSYHENGQIKQYLEAIASRANGRYTQWHQNGQLYIQARVVEGAAQLNESSQITWLFDGPCEVFDEEGHISAIIPYEKGLLEGDSRYFYPSGAVKKVMPYSSNLLNGDVLFFDEAGELIGASSYQEDQQEGKSYHQGGRNCPKLDENYRGGKLVEGDYWSSKGEKLAEVRNGAGFKAIYEEGLLKELVEYQMGEPNGQVKLFNQFGGLESIYHSKEGKKHGEEWVYWNGNRDKPRLYVSWYQDEIHGVVKTWYEDGSLESQREMAHNLRQGISSAWYLDGGIMLVEEYEDDQLVSGKYYKKGRLDCVSSIERGSGIATLYDQNGVFLRKVHYKRGKIVPDIK